MSATIDASPGKRYAAIAVFLLGLAIAITTHFTIPGQTSLWGLTPVVVFAVIALLGVDIVLSTIGAIVLGAIMTGTTPIGMGKLLAEGLAADRPDTLPFPIEKPLAVSNPGKMDRIIRHVMIPAARTGQRIGLL